MSVKIMTFLSCCNNIVLKITQNNGRRKNIREEANIFIYVQKRIK